MASFANRATTHEGNSGTPLSDVEFQIVSRNFYSGSNGANSAMTQPRGDPTA